MERSYRKRDALRYLYNRYIKDDPEKIALLEVERVNVFVARLIFELRTSAELSQKELAELVGTTQSVISRLEDADYDGHSLTMLDRIATALNQRLMVSMVAKDPDAAAMRYAFQLMMQNLRREKGMTIQEVSEGTKVDASQLISIEHNVAYRPTPLALHRLADFYGIPEERLAQLAGAIRKVPDEVRESASRFAAKSDSFAKLTKDERRALDGFVKSLKSAAG